jgi:hypothetical protein
MSGKIFYALLTVLLVLVNFLDDKNRLSRHDLRET